MNYFCFRITLSTLSAMNKSNKFLLSFIGMILFQIFMSMEEIIGHFPQWLTLLTRKIQSKISFFPVIQISDQVFMFINLIIIVALFGFLSLVFIESKWSRMVAVILGLLEILNGVLHIVTSVYFMKYVPGTISAVGLIIFALFVIFVKPASSRREIPEELQ